MGFLDRLTRLERKAAPPTGTLRLPDGELVRYHTEEMLSALGAVIRGEEHRLLPLIREAERVEGLAAVVKAVQRNKEEHGR